MKNSIVLIALIFFYKLAYPYLVPIPIDTDGSIVTGTLAPGEFISYSFTSTGSYKAFVFSVNTVSEKNQSSKCKFSRMVKECQKLYLVKES